MGIAWLLGKKSSYLTPLRSLVGLLCVAALASLALSLYWSYSSDPLFVDKSQAELFAFYFSAPRAWQFIAGALLAVGTGWYGRFKPLATFGASLGVALVLWASLAFDEFTKFPGSAALAPTLGAVLLIGAGSLKQDNPVSNVLSRRWFVRLGDISYSLYLWHWPFIVFAGALFPHNGFAIVCGAAFSFGPAILSFRYVENPFRHVRKDRGQRTLMAAAVFVFLSLGAAVALDAFHQGVEGTTAMAEFDEFFEPHIDVASGCDYSLRDPLRTQSDCTWAAPNSVGTAFLVGDSNAGQFSEAFVEGMNSNNLNAVIARYSECPFGDTTLIKAGEPKLGCRQFVGDTLQEILDTKPDLVVLASSSDGYIEKSEFELADPQTGDRVAGPNDKAMAWSMALESTLNKLTNAGIATFVINPVPKFDGWFPTECAIVLWAFRPRSCAASIELSEVNELRARAIDAENEAALATGTQVLDFEPNLCGPTSCSTYADGNWLWRDGGHLTTVASKQLTPEFNKIAQDTIE